MHERILVSDFDGTITKADTLSKFLEDYADPKWLDIENDWRDGKFGSQECLIKQFALVPNLTPSLVESFLDTIEIDEYFIPFCNKAKDAGMPVVVLSDGLDYFINKILEKYKIDFINVITNHAYFNEYGKFIIEFPNESHKCLNNAGTCKCKVVKNLQKRYKTVYYAGDGASDFCVSKHPNIIFAKSALAQHCKNNNINHIQFNNYSKLIEEMF
jgi:2,3-diketo-5-methylthio-1-phosphopentane phosphatase